jgi:hypothetical protein
MWKWGGTMVIMYSASNGGQEEKLLQVLKTVVSESDIKLYQTIEALSSGLRQSRNDANIAVLVASTKEDLGHLLSIRDYLWDMKIILIVSDSDRDTLAKSHILRPRFLSVCTSDFVDVAAVLSLMIRNMGANKSIDVHT